MGRIVTVDVLRVGLCKLTRPCWEEPLTSVNWFALEAPAYQRDDTMLRKAARKHVYNIYARTFQATGSSNLGIGIPCKIGVNYHKLIPNGLLVKYDPFGLCGPISVLNGWNYKDCRLYLSSCNRCWLQTLEVQREEILSFLLLPRIP